MEPNEYEPKIVISEENGFAHLTTEGVSSKVFVKEGNVYKLSNRNSLERQKSDLVTLREELEGYEDRLPNSEITECEFEGEVYTCVIQPMIDGQELKKLDSELLEEVLRNNKDFLLKLLKYFFEAVEARKLYPDIVGYPADPEYFNSINLLLENSSKKVILCDVGLSPHENTLKDKGLDFYDSENVKTYTEKMKKFQEYLLALL